MVVPAPGWQSSATVVREGSWKVAGKEVACLLLQDWKLPEPCVLLLLQGASIRDVLSVVVVDQKLYSPILVDGFQPYDPPPRFKRVLLAASQDEPIDIKEAIQSFASSPFWC